MSGMTRREFLGTATAGLGVLLVGCGSSPSSNGSGAWTFTDDRGNNVSLPSQPKRIVAYDLAAAALMNLGLKCVGIFASLPLAQNPQLSGLDLNGVETISSSYANLNLEALAQVRPDVVVTIFDPRLTGPDIGFPDTDTEAKVKQLAPVIAIDSTKDITDVIDRFEQLGKALGVDSGGATVVDAHKHFSSASTSVQTATAAKPGLKVLALAVYQGVGVSFRRPDLHPTFRLYQKLGVNMVHPTSPPGNINTAYDLFFYERVSLELVGQYPADLIMYSNLPGAQTPSQLAAIPTWAALPAVQAGQLLPWRNLDPFSYKVLAEDLDAIAKAINGAHIVT